jgi:tetratricopeptide (TPR) repeat protein
MKEFLPQAYLIGLIVLLGAAAVALTRQILRVRRDESILSRLEGSGSGNTAGDSAALYELASVQLRKRLYGQAGDHLKRALKLAVDEQAPAEARALIENALGFSLAAQSKYKAAIRHYRSAIRAKPDYPVALNNLAFALEKQGLEDEARSIYTDVLAIDAGNATAHKRLKAIERRSGTDGKKAA